MNVLRLLTPVRSFIISFIISISGYSYIRFAISRSHNSVVDYAITCIVLRIICLLCRPVLSIGACLAYLENVGDRKNAALRYLKLLLNLVPLAGMLYMYSTLPRH